MAEAKLPEVLQKILSQLEEITQVQQVIVNYLAQCLSLDDSDQDSTASDDAAMQRADALALGKDVNYSSVRKGPSDHGRPKRKPSQLPAELFSDQEEEEQ